MKLTKEMLRLYAVTDRSWLREQTLCEQVEQALIGGATLVQLREKELDEEAFLETAKQYAQDGDREALAAFFREMEVLTGRWQVLLQSSRVENAWDVRQRELAVYFITRYWLQAVADYDLIGRVKYMIASCLLIHGLEGDFLEKSQLFSKEIENNPDNVDAILDGAYTNRALTDVNLLSLLLKF